MLRSLIDKNFPMAKLNLELILHLVLAMQKSYLVLYGSHNYSLLIN